MKKASVIARFKDALTPKPLPALLNQHDALSARLDDLHRQHAAEAEALRQTQYALRTARDAEIQATQAARNRRCGALEKNDDGHLTADAESECARRVAEVPEVQAARLALRCVQARVNESEARLKAIADERDALALERYGLKDAPGSATLDELLALQARLTAARDEVARLDARLDALSATPLPPLPDPSNADSDLAAAIAAVELGEAEADILPALELQCAAIRREREAAQAERNRSELLRQGLTARLTATTAEAERLEAGHKQALSWHLEAELNGIASDYRQAAERLLELRGRLVGLSRVLQYRVDHAAGQRIGVERPTHDDALGARLIVPDASLPALAGMQVEDTRHFREAAYETELNRLRQTGIEV